MIKSLCLKNVNPKAFVDAPPLGASSEVWNCIQEFERGRSYLVEAGSGRGKSSLCSFLYGLRADFVGKIEFCYDDGVVLDNSVCDYVAVRQNSFSIMFQEYRLFPELSPVDNVMLKNRLTGYTTEEAVRSMLSRLGLEDRLDTPCGKISFGQQQRVAFVRALCQPADFIFLDEPVSHLDTDNAKVMAEMLRERQIKDSLGIIVTSIGHRLPYEYDKVLKL